MPKLNVIPSAAPKAKMITSEISIAIEMKTTSMRMRSTASTISSKSKLKMSV